MKLLNISIAIILAISIASLVFLFAAPAPTNVITTNRVAMQSPPSALEVPVMDGMSKTNYLLELQNGGTTMIEVSPSREVFVWGKLVGHITTNSFVPIPPVATNTISPTFADGVLIAVAVLRTNPGFATLLTQQEQVALCARVWQQQRGNVK